MKTGKGGGWSAPAAKVPRAAARGYQPVESACVELMKRVIYLFEKQKQLVHLC
jgi:hypothetical protein